jgi:hypothetical protein
MGAEIQPDEKEGLREGEQRWEGERCRVGYIIAVGLKTRERVARQIILRCLSFPTVNRQRFLPICIPN